MNNSQTVANLFAMGAHCPSLQSQLEKIPSSALSTIKKECPGFQLQRGLDVDVENGSCRLKEQCLPSKFTKDVLYCDNHKDKLACNSDSERCKWGSRINVKNGEMVDFFCRIGEMADDQRLEELHLEKVENELKFRDKDDGRGGSSNHSDGRGHAGVHQLSSREKLKMKKGGKLQKYKNQKNDMLHMGLNLEAAFNNFQKFNASSNPFKDKKDPISKRFKQMFQKLDGRYFNELAQSIVEKARRRGDPKFKKKALDHSEWRQSVSGASFGDWQKNAKFLDQAGFLDDNFAYVNQWMIQVPRVYDKLKKKGVIGTFGDMLRNIFEPMFMATLYPDDDDWKLVAKLLQNVGAMDSVDDESKPETMTDEERNLHPENYESKKNPDYDYYLFYMNANLRVLNALRKSRNMNEIKFRPHAGESGKQRHLTSAFLLADGINHGNQLKDMPAHQYLFYLSQLPQSMSPRSNHFLFTRLKDGPFGKFHKIGFNIAPSSDDPLMFHTREDALQQEYETVQDSYELSDLDMTECAIRSIHQSGFPWLKKDEFLRENYGKLKGDKGFQKRVKERYARFEEECEELGNAKVETRDDDRYYNIPAYCTPSKTAGDAFSVALRERLTFTKVPEKLTKKFESEEFQNLIKSRQITVSLKYGIVFGAWVAKHHKLKLKFSQFVKMRNKIDRRLRQDDVTAKANKRIEILLDGYKAGQKGKENKNKTGARHTNKFERQAKEETPLADQLLALLKEVDEFVFWKLIQSNDVTKTELAAAETALDSSREYQDFKKRLGKSGKSDFQLRSLQNAVKKYNETNPRLWKHFHKVDGHIHRGAIMTERMLYNKIREQFLSEPNGIAWRGNVPAKK